MSLLLALALVAGSTAAIDRQVVASNIPYLVDIEHAGDGSGRLFLVRQGGRILIYNGTQILATPFVDLSGVVTPSLGEQGLLGLAFHPQYAANGFFYVDYTDTDGNTVIARYHAATNSNVADPNSATVVLTLTQPFSNHNGGQIRFGPDGFLYIALGDGGSGGDPRNNGQSLNTLLGKLLRIDVDSAAPYAIPPGNPFASNPNARGEIWAYGLRNPWRFSFDRRTSDLIVADVGQNLWEEVDVQASGAGGSNYGWRLMEGTHCYQPATNCNPGTLTLPLVEYSHALGCSVTGGFRYRGSNLADLVGTYVFSDYCSGRIWGAVPNANGAWRATQLTDGGLNVTTFGEDPAGEIYLSHYASKGSLYRLVAATSTRPLLSITKTGTGAGRITSSPTAVECAYICAARLASGAVVTLTATADPGSTFAGWSGDPDCANGVVTMSADRSCIAVFDAPFTDDPLVAGITTIKAAHVLELRSRIDTARSNVGLSPFNWTDPTLSTGTSLVRAAHIMDMRAALGQVFSARHLSLPIYTDPVLAAGTAIKAAHVSELRAALLAVN